jgi:hypothetical protein
MQLKFLTAIALATLAVAAPGYTPPYSGGGSGGSGSGGSSGSGSGGSGSSGSGGSSSSGSVCCTQQVTNKSSLFSTLTGILDIPIGNVIGSLGLDCTVGLIALYCGICCLVSLLQSVNVLGSSNTCGTTTNVVQCNSSGNSGMYLIYGSNATAFKLLMTLIGLLGLIGIGCVPIVA